MLGFSEKTDKNPSRQARVIVALTSPRTCDVVIKLPDVIMKYSITLLFFPSKV